MSRLRILVLGPKCTPQRVHSNVLVIRRLEGEAVFSGPAVTGAFREAE
jgi:hypothetical protein